MAQQIKDFFINKWKWVLAFFAAIIALFLSRISKRKAHEFYENRVKSDSDILDAEREAREKAIQETKKMEEEHRSALTALKENFKNRKEDLQSSIEDEKKSLKEKSISEAIANLTGAEHIKKDD